MTDGTTYTRAQIEAGKGRYTNSATTVIQRGEENVFQTQPAVDGWRVGHGWHIAGGMGKTTPVEWVDLW